MKNIIILIISGFLIFINGAAISKDRITVCDSCNSTQYSDAALGVARDGTESIHVVNRGSRVIKRFLVKRESGSGHSDAAVTEVSTDPDVVSDIYQILDFHEAVTANRHVDVNMIPMPSGHGIDSALDIVHSSNGMTLKQGVRAYVMDNYMALIESIAVDSPASLADLLEGARGLLTVEFPDGSAYTFNVMDGVELSDGSAVVVVESQEGSGIDANGRPIPESPANLPGINRSGQGVTGYVQLASNMGIAVERLSNCTAEAEFGCQVIRDQLECSYTVECQ